MGKEPVQLADLVHQRLGIIRHGQTIRITNHDRSSPGTRSGKEQAKKKKLASCSPMTVARRMHGFGGGVPVVESSRDANGGGRRMSEFKAYWLQLKSGAAGVVMVVFHSW
jgi:hypothetical protein